MKKAKIAGRLLRCGVVAALGLGAMCQPAGAAEGGAGVYLLGTFGPQTGILPEAGTYLTNYSYYYTANAGRTSEGGLIRADLTVDVFSNFTTVTHVTDWTLWGGQYGFGVFVPAVYAEYDASIQIGPLTGRFSDDNCGLGDIVLTPLLLGWHDGNSHFLGITNVYFPTGSYNTGTGVNLGKNRYAVEPALGYTYLNEENGRELSLGLGYTVNFKNTETDYRTGDEFHADLLLAQHLPNGMMLGTAGYWYEQVTGDSGAGAILGDFKGRVYGLGPILSYNTTISDHLFAISFKYYWEFEAKNRLEGDAAFLQLTYQF
jgi:hypothetical protein